MVVRRALLVLLRHRAGQGVRSLAELAARLHDLVEVNLRLVGCRFLRERALRVRDH